MKEKNNAANSEKSSKKGEHLKQYQWKPGESGNLSGRTKDDFLLAKLHRDKLREPVPAHVMTKLAGELFVKNSPGYKAFVKLKLNWAEAIVERNFHKALTPDADMALKIIWEMLEGRPTQKIAGADGGPIEFSRLDNERAELDRLTVAEVQTLKGLQDKAKGRATNDRQRSDSAE